MIGVFVWNTGFWLVRQSQHDAEYHTALTFLILISLVSFSINNRLYCNIIIDVFFYDRMIALHTVKDDKFIIFIWFIIYDNKKIRLLPQNKGILLNFCSEKRCNYLYDCTRYVLNVSFLGSKTCVKLCI